MFLSSFMARKRSIIIGIIGIVVLGLGVVALINQQGTSPPQGTRNTSLSVVGSTARTQNIAPSVEIARINDDASGIFSGKAMPGANVQISLNGEVLSIVRADSEGDWLYIYRMQDQLLVGQHAVTILASLDGYADSSTDEVLLLDIPPLEATGTGEDIHPTAKVYAYDTQRGLRVLQGDGQGTELAAIALVSPTLPPISSMTETMAEAQDAPNFTTITPEAPINDPLGALIGTIQNDDTAQVTSLSNMPTTVAPTTPREETLPLTETLAEAGSQAPVTPFENVTPISLQSMGLSADSQNITITGTAEPGANLSVMINDLPSASVPVATDGTFTITVLSDNIQQKVQTVVLRQSKAGRLLGTTTALLNPQGSATTSTASLNNNADDTPARTITVRKGETLWALAVRVYGNGSQHEKILAANQNLIKSPRDLKPGMILVIP